MVRRRRAGRVVERSRDDRRAGLRAMLVPRRRLLSGPHAVLWHVGLGLARARLRLGIAGLVIDEEPALDRRGDGERDAGADRVIRLVRLQDGLVLGVDLAVPARVA